MSSFPFIEVQKFSPLDWSWVSLYLDPTTNKQEIIKNTLMRVHGLFTGLYSKTVNTGRSSESEF